MIIVSILSPCLGRTFNITIERDSEGYYVASVPKLHGCHTQARSMDKLRVRIWEAIAVCLEVADAEQAV